MEYANTVIQIVYQNYLQDVDNVLQHILSLFKVFVKYYLLTVLLLIFKPTHVYNVKLDTQYKELDVSKINLLQGYHQIVKLLVHSILIFVILVIMDLLMIMASVKKHRPLKLLIV